MQQFIEASLGLFLCFATGFTLLIRPRFAIYVGIFYLIIGIVAVAMYAVLGMWKEEYQTPNAIKEQSRQALLGMGETGGDV